MDASTLAALGDRLRALPLKDMDPSLLSFAILREATDLDVDTASLTAAMELAAYLHRSDSRGARQHLPVDTYITHPFRLVLRLVRYGCRDDAVLTAAALHDTVEDHPDEVVAVLGGSACSTPDDTSARGGALALLATTFGTDVARVVSAVTTPTAAPDDTEETRHEAYRRHVAAAIDDPQVFLVKVADFVDNAGSLRHMTDGARRSRLTRKYAPLAPVFQSALDRHRAALPLGQDGVTQITDHLATTGTWLKVATARADGAITP